MRRLIALLVITFVAPSYAVGNAFAKERCAHDASATAIIHDSSADGRDHGPHEHGKPAGTAPCPYNDGSIACMSGGTSIFEAAYVQTTNQASVAETPAFAGPARPASHQSAPEPPPPKS